MENTPLLTAQQGAILIKLARDSLTQKTGPRGQPRRARGPESRFGRPGPVQTGRYLCEP
jgi:hypothetical protein